MSSRSSEETLSLEECWLPCGLTERPLFLGEEPPVKWCLKAWHMARMDLRFPLAISGQCMGESVSGVGEGVRVSSVG